MVNKQTITGLFVLALWLLPACTPGFPPPSSAATPSSAPGQQHPRLNAEKGAYSEPFTNTEAALTPSVPMAAATAMPPDVVISLPTPSVWPSRSPAFKEIATLLPTTAAPEATVILEATAYFEAVDMIEVATPTAQPAFPSSAILGYSLNGNPITVYRFGQGKTSLVLIGGIHGGYEWNTILLAYAILDHFSEDKGEISPDVSLYIIPNANPDGLFQVSGQVGRFSPNSLAADTSPGRFNARRVDLNRNWDCNWSSQATWRQQPVSGGEFPFSEPETQILRDFLLDLRPAAVLFWHSAANGVFAGGCGEPYPPSVTLARLYGEAAGYPVHGEFFHYAVTGEASDWLSTQEIPTISVELRNHTNLDLAQNLAGVYALLAFYRANDDQWTEEIPLPP